MSQFSWHDKLQARWAARLGEDWAAGAPAESVEMRRLPTSAERVIAADRAAVWAALMLLEEDRPWGSALAGAPLSGLGAKHVAVGPPLPPHGLRLVMYTEVTDLAEMHWMTSQTHGGFFEHTETLALTDAPEGGTHARITGWHLRPAPKSADLTTLHAELHRLAVMELDRLAARAEGSAPPAG